MQGSPGYFYFPMRLRNILTPPYEDGDAATAKPNTENLHAGLANGKLQSSDWCLATGSRRIHHQTRNDC